MEHTYNTLAILAEVTTGFVAFSAIVASLRVTLGERLTPFQNLLVHFFTESGMLSVSIALLPLVLGGFWSDASTVGLYSVLYALVSDFTYLAFYVRRRLQIHAPTPLPSLMVMIGYAAWMIVLLAALVGIYWKATLPLVAAFCFWCLFSGVVIFVYFLTTFVDRGEAE